VKHKAQNKKNAFLHSILLESISGYSFFCICGYHLCHCTWV